MTTRNGVMFRLVLMLVAAKVVLLLLVVSHHPDVVAWPDTIMYTRAAQGLLETGTFQRNGQPEVFRVPGYPLFLVPFVLASGGGMPWLAVGGHILIVLLAAWFAARLTPETAPGRSVAPAVAMLLTLLDPAVVLGEFAILSEILFMGLFTAGMYCVAQFVERRRAGGVIAGMLLMSVATYVRPIALYLPFMVAVPLLWWSRRNPRLMTAILAGVLLHCAATGSWMLRNQRIFGVPVFSTVGAAFAYHYMAAATVAAAEGRPYSEVQHQFEREVVSDNPALQAQYNQSRAREVFARYPVATAWVALKGVAVAAVDPGTYAVANMAGLRNQNSGILYRFHELGPVEFGRHLVQNERPFLLLTLGGVVWMAMFWVACARGFWVRFQQRRRVDLLLVLAVAYFLTPSGPAAHSRFRVPVVPLLATFAATGIASLQGRSIDGHGSLPRDQTR